MIKKICASLILISLFIALPLAAMGIKRVDLGPAFLSFMNRVSTDLEGWKVDIPSIPMLEPMTEGNNMDAVNFFVSFANFIFTILNVVILLLNVVIQLVQFICTLIWDLRLLIENLEAIGDPNYIWPLV